MRIYYEDTDCGGIVYNANYMKFCERARSEVFFRAGISFDESSSFVVTNVNANFIKPAILGDVIEIRSKITTMKRASIVIRQEIYKVGQLNRECDEILLFSCDVSLAFLSGLKATRMSEEMVKFLTQNENFIIR